MNFTAGTALGTVLTLALVTLVGIRAGKNVKSAKDFTSGSGMGIPMIAGSLVGTLAGPALVVAGSYLLPAEIDPLFLGMAGALLICVLGWILGKQQQSE